MKPSTYRMLNRRIPKIAGWFFLGSVAIGVILNSYLPLMGKILGGMLGGVLSIGFMLCVNFVWFRLFTRRGRKITKQNMERDWELRQERKAFRRQLKQEYREARKMVPWYWTVFYEYRDDD